MASRRPCVALPCQVVPTQHVVVRKSLRCITTTQRQCLEIVPQTFPVSCDVPLSASKPVKLEFGRVPDNATLREAKLALDELFHLKESRIKVLKTLSNPWPEVKSERVPRERLSFGWTGGLTPHIVFRERLKLVKGRLRETRQLIRAQILQCNTPKSIYQVIAASFQHRHAKIEVARLHESLIRACYRCRNSVDDCKVLSVINNIIWRFGQEGLPIAPDFIRLGVKFSARSRDIQQMKKYLRLCREHDLLNGTVYRAIIAKFSMGNKGLGEIRNGRWKREDLLQVLLGFDDLKHLPRAEQFHLETFTDRSDWLFLHGWIVALSRCKAISALEHEWELWLRSEGRREPRNLTSTHHLKTTRKRGDYWFIEQMILAGGIEQAWQMLADSGLEFEVLKDRSKSKLLDRFELAGRYGFWNDAMCRELIKKLDRDLAAIEKHLGVTWIRSNIMEEGGNKDEATSSGRHVKIIDQEEVLNRLGDPLWKYEPDFGYPYDEQDQALHHAKETTLSIEET